MAISVKAIITNALRKLGVIDPSPQEHADGLTALRQMLDGWSGEDLLCPFLATEQFALSTTQAFYSMGPDGDWDTVRPERVEIVRLLRADGTTVPVALTTPHVMQFQGTVPNADPTGWRFTADSLYGYVEFNAYPLAPQVLVTSQKPFNAAALDNFDAAYDEGAGPTTVYPSGFTLTGIQTPLDFPPGYEQAIIYNLAVHLRPEYPGLDLPQEVVALAAGAKSNIKRRNLRAPQLVHERTMQGGRRPYDIYSG